MENNIRKLRKERNMTGTKLAEMLSITPTYFYELERGKKRLSAEMASKLAEIFGVSIDYLLGGAQGGKVPERNSPIPDWATPKDKRDFKKMLEDDEPIMFDGVPLEEEDKEKIKRVMEAMFWNAKEKNKKTYGRRKKPSESE